MDEAAVSATPEPESGMTVVSVDELVDRLVQSAPVEEAVAAEEEPTPEADEGGAVVEDVVPGLIGDAIEILAGIRSSAERLESIEQTVNHPLLTTPFQDYTVTEGLLLLLLLCVFLKACMTMVRRAFAWLLS